MPNYQPTPTDTSGNVKSAIQNSDTFNNLLVCERNNQISVSFAKGQTLAPLNVTTTGGGGATVAGGEATFSSGTAANGSVIATSKAVTSYIAGFSIYLLGSVGWQVPPTGANETAFFGLWDVVNDGIYIGYSGTTFGVAIMSGGVQSFTPRSEWNGDALDGGQSSSFTRDGLSEAINFSFHNVFRIEFAWLGSGPIFFEVLSPDGQWVIFHTIRRPNISTFPSVENPNLPASIVITKVGADATNVTMTSSCWGAGTTAPNNQAVVTNFPATQPVSAASLPLPTGAATLAEQQAMETTLQAIGAVVEQVNTTLGSPAQAGGAVSVSNFPATQPVSGTVAVSNLPATQPVSGSVSVANFPATQPVSIASAAPVKPDGAVWALSGTSANVAVTNFPATQPVSAASLPLPTGAATLAEQQTINTTLGSPMQQTGGSVTPLGTFSDSSPPALTAGQTAPLQVNSSGSLFVKPYRRSDVIPATGSIASTTPATLLAAQAAGVYADLAALVLTTNPTGNLAGFAAIISDGTNSYKFWIYDKSGGGQQNLQLNFSPPLPAKNAATAWTIALDTASAATVYYVATFVAQKAS